MAALEVLALNTVIPQIQAPQVGDSYLFPRVAEFSAGTALLPSLAGPSDPDTGMWFPAANTIAWSTGGTERMRITSAGNVGIGKTPASGVLLDVNGVAAFGAGTALLPSLASTSDLDTGMWFPAANTVAWSTGGLEAMRINPNRRVGIGSSGNDFHRLTIVENSNNNASILCQTTSDTVAPGVTQLRSRTSGSVQNGDGLGATVFQGYDGVSGFASASIFGEVDGVAGAGSVPTRLRFLTTPSGSIIQQERMRITSAGNVGIGTSSPSQKLDVIGQIRTTLGVTVDGGTTNNGAVAISTSNNQSLGGPSIYFLGSSNGTLFATSGTQQGTVNFYGPQYSGGCAITAFATENQNATSLGGELRIYTTPNGTTSQQERMRITSAGNVGIGTTSPAALLHVAGAGLFRATLAGTAATLPAESASLSVLNGAGYGTTPSVSFNIGANNWDAVNNNNTFQWSLTTLSPGAGAGLELNINSRSFDGTSTYTTTPRLTIGAAGNTAIGTTITSGARLTVRGSGTSSSTTGLLVEDSGGTDNLVIRDDGAYAFRGGTVGLAQTGYTTFTNLTTDRTCDADNTTVAELADILGTLIVDLKTKGIIAS